MLVSLGAPAAGAAPTAITLVPGQTLGIGSLTSSVQLLEDATGERDIGDVSSIAADSGFVDATPDSANVGFSASTWWVRFSLRNTGEEPRMVYLRQGYPLIDLLDFYQPLPQGEWNHVATGDRRPFGSRAVQHRAFLFPITVPAGAERTYYLRFESQGPVDIHLSLFEPSELAAGLSREQLAYGVYFGCVLMLLVWSGLVFVAVRDPAFFAYFLYVATFGVYMTVNTGFAYQFLWPDSPRWANTSLLMLLSLSLVTALHFSLTILRARNYAPRMERVARGLQALALIAVVLTPFLSYALLVRPVALLIFASVIFMMAIGMVSLLSGSRPARYYVIAWSAFLAGSVVFLMKNFGVIPHTFLSQHSWQIGALVEMILLSMTLSSRMNELKNQSRTDPLTLLGNRRLFDDRLPVEFSVARNMKRPLSLLMMDIDNFKAYNDQHGHSLGDEAIKVVGAALRRHARKPVFACRYGGDEFCVILPGTDSEAAALIAERLRTSVEASRGTAPPITLSIGYASMSDGEFPSHDKFFDAADAALYSAKQAGRNQISGFLGRRAEDPPARTPSSPT